MVTQVDTMLEGCIVLLTEIARMAIHDYKRYANKYNRLHDGLPDGASKECKLFRIKRNTDKIERFFKDDPYGVFDERGANFVEKLRSECNYQPFERITFEQYCTLLPQEAREEKVHPHGIARVVAANKRKGR